jgi:SAM-dependent methyltransferase
MGFNTSDLRFLLSGMDGSSVCTLGRLTLFVSQSDLDQIAREYEKPNFKLPLKATRVAEDILTPLGFDVESMDISTYEGASIVHDLNKPVSPELVERFDIVWDGGTLEHVFDFPSALRNAMSMVKVGGHFAMRTPANNLCGHGFYQFSPELFFRIFAPQNGFELHRIYVLSRGQRFHVRNPADIGGRVQLLDNVAAELMVHARKVGPVPDTISIQQSDYVEAWTEKPRQDGKLKNALRKRLSPVNVERISFLLNDLRTRRAVRQWKANSKLSNRLLYRPVSDWRQPSKEAFQL